MLNVSQLPNNNKYTPSFRGKIDYSQIYKEMEKISLKQEEKIVPKISLRKKLETILPKKTMGDITKKLIKVSLGILCVPILIPTIIIYITFGRFIKEDELKFLSLSTLIAIGTITAIEYPRIRQISTHEKQQNMLLTKIDSLEKEWDKNTISLEEYQKLANKAIDEYDAHSHAKLIKQELLVTFGFRFEEFQKTHGHAQNGEITYIKDNLEPVTISGLDCSEIDKKVAELKQKVANKNPAIIQADTVVHTPQADTLSVSTLKEQFCAKIDSLQNLFKKDSITSGKFTREVEQITRKIRQSKL